jgi:putative ABC transport system permease protein
MKISEVYLLGFEALKDRKVRSILTILMVVVGSSLMVALNGLTAGFSAFIQKQFSSLATNVLTLSTSQRTFFGGGGFGGGGGGGGPRPEESQATTVAPIVFNSAVVSKLKTLPLVTDAIGIYQGAVTLESQGSTYSARVYSVDFSQLGELVPTMQMAQGIPPTVSDPTAVYVGDSVANPSGQPGFLTTGQTIQLTANYNDPVTRKASTETKSFVVRGVFAVTGNFNIDGAVVISPDAANGLLHKSNKFDSIAVVTNTADDVSTVQSEIQTIYGNHIGITSNQALLQSRQAFSSGFSSFVQAIALVALVVGAVGIITTLYTSVTERIREIGTIKAIGAFNRDILLIFLAEATIIGFAGASIGVATGIVTGTLMTTVFKVSITGNSNLSQPAVFLPGDLLYVWSLSVVLSLLAGIYPAWKASRLEPLVALRRD